MKIIHKLKDIRGKKLYGLKILGIPIYLITKTKPNHYNFFFLFIPLIRFEKVGAKYSIHLLLFILIYRFIKKFFSKVKIVKTSNKFKISCFRRNIFEKSIVEPYKFPTAQFKG